MIPVLQEKEYPEGDCMSACLASILELPLAEVPIEHGDGWFDRTNAWLTARTGLALACYGPEIRDLVDEEEFWIGGVDSPRNPEIGHAVVMRGRELAHDPYPNAQPVDLGTLDDCFVFLDAGSAPA